MSDQTAIEQLEKEWMEQDTFLDYRNWLQSELLKVRAQRWEVMEECAIIVAGYPTASAQAAAHAIRERFKE